MSGTWWDRLKVSGAQSPAPLLPGQGEKRRRGNGGLFRLSRFKQCNCLSNATVGVDWSGLSTTICEKTQIWRERKNQTKDNGGKTKIEKNLNVTKPYYYISSYFILKITTLQLWDVISVEMHSGKAFWDSPTFFLHYWLRMYYFQWFGPNRTFPI